MIFMLVSNSRYIMILEQEYFILFQQSFKLIAEFNLQMQQNSD